MLLYTSDSRDGISWGTMKASVTTMRIKEKQLVINGFHPHTEKVFSLFLRFYVMPFRIGHRNTEKVMKLFMP